MFTSADDIVEREVADWLDEGVVDWPLIEEPEPDCPIWLLEEPLPVVDWPVVAPRSCVLLEPLVPEPRCVSVALGADGAVDPDVPLDCANAGAASRVVAKR